MSSCAAQDTAHLHFALIRLDKEPRWWKGTLRRLIVILLYGAGLRLLEALTLRVKDECLFLATCKRRPEPGQLHDFGCPV